MSDSPSGLPEVLKRSAPLRVGFIPAADCAPLVFAQESGLFEQYELRVELQRQSRWANLQDRVSYGELDAAHAPATLPFVANFALDSDRGACVTGLVLSLQGNAITLSRSLWDEGAQDAPSLRNLIYRNWGKRTYTFALEFPHSPQYFLLRQWLQTGEILPHQEVRIVIVPPAQLFPTLKLGYIDGFCAGEPWTSLAAAAGLGVCVGTSAELAPMHPEKVLMVRRDFAAARAGEHERLLAALLEACAFCDRPDNRPLLAEMLARRQYVNAPAECLREPTPRPARATNTTAAGALPVFHRHNANDPTDDKAAWLIGRLYELMDQSVLKIPRGGRTPVLKNVFRRDLFARARAAVSQHARTLRQEADNYEPRIRQTA
jgi:ABC-type nitrate/sulfonate/bicarbonate transport system substrate-binding protein